ncbi:MAG: PRC-barrel domain-containing protein [Methanobacteriota archaeon]
MSKALSEYYGMDMYTQKAQFVGKLSDVILNLEKGEIMRLSLHPLRGDVLSGDDVKRILQQESIPYEEVLEVGDIIIVEKQPVSTKK